MRFEIVDGMTMPIIDVVEADGSLTEMALVRADERFYEVRVDRYSVLRFRRVRSLRNARGTECKAWDKGPRKLSEETMSDIEELISHDLWDSGWVREGWGLTKK